MSSERVKKNYLATTHCPLVEMRPSSSKPEPAHSKQPWPSTPASAAPPYPYPLAGTPQSFSKEIPKNPKVISLLVDAIIAYTPTASGRNFCGKCRLVVVGVFRPVEIGMTEEIFWGQCTRSSDHRTRRSVAVAGESIFDNFEGHLEPDLSDKGDLLVNSCKASDAAMNTESSGKNGSSRLMSSGIKGVIWLRGRGLINKTVVARVTYSARRKYSQACEQPRAYMTRPGWKRLRSMTVSIQATEKDGLVQV